MKYLMTLALSLCFLSLNAHETWDLDLAVVEEAQATPADSVETVDKSQVTSDTVNGKVDSIISLDRMKKNGQTVKVSVIVVATNNNEKVNLVLGPTKFVEELIKDVQVGQTVSAEVFKKRDAKRNTYLAKSITVDGKKIQFRDDNFKPVWWDKMKKQFMDSKSSY